MPDDILIFDQAAVAAHRRRSSMLDPAGRFLYHEIRGRLIDRLADIRRRFHAILDLGILDAAADRTFAPDATVIAMDRVRTSGLSLVGSAELPPFARGGFDLVLSTLGLQWVNDLPGALAQLQACLRPDGLFLAALFGGGTLRELREVLTLAELEITGGASPRVAPLVDLRAAAGLLQRAHFALPVADIETIVLTFPDMFALMKELRALGDTNALVQRSRYFTRRDVMLKAAELYAERFPAPGGRIVATFDAIMLTGWSPSASQPKPLAPGSATRSLADELKS